MTRFSRIPLVLGCMIGLLLPVSRLVLADVVVATNGERLIGNVIQETEKEVIFESESYGRLTIRRERIQDIQRAGLPTTRPAMTNPAPAEPGLPAGVGTDGFDWLELKSGEWLKGELKYVQKRKVEIDSRELEEQKFDLKDVRRIYTARPMFTKFKDGLPVFAPVKIEGDVVTVEAEQRSIRSRDDLSAITPGGKRERDFWSGNLSLSFNMQSGNTEETDLTLQTSAVRRTPATQLDLEYLQSFSIINGVENARNLRFNGAYDIFLDNGFFIRPLGLEYYRDPLANIDHRLTGSIGVGYLIVDNDDTQWTISAGPSFQRTWYADVAPGEDKSASSPGATLQSKFKTELTKGVDLTLQYNVNLAGDASGGVSQHAEATTKFKITRSFDINLSLIWDRSSNPRSNAEGSFPRSDELQLTAGVGWSF